MNKNISLSQLKDKINGNVVIIILLVVLGILLGYACWYTFDEGVRLEASVSKQITEYNDNRNLVKNLKELQLNSEYYLAQQKKYDEVIAEADSYNSVDYYVELSELCDKYELTINEIQVGEMVADGSVNSAISSLVVVGDEIHVKQLAQHIVSEKEVARIDSISMTQQEDGTVIAALQIVNFTK